MMINGHYCCPSESKIKLSMATLICRSETRRKTPIYNQDSFCLTLLRQRHTFILYLQTSLMAAWSLCVRPLGPEAHAASQFLLGLKALHLNLSTSWLLHIVFSPCPFSSPFGADPHQSGMYLYLRACVLSQVQLFVTPWTLACQAPLPMEFSRQAYYSGLSFPTPVFIFMLGGGESTLNFDKIIQNFHVWNIVFFQNM